VSDGDALGTDSRATMARRQFSPVNTPLMISDVGNECKTDADFSPSREF
jgi:hypothetical protein